MPAKSREKCAVTGCHDAMFLFYRGKPVCAKHWARDWVNGFSLDVELGFSKKEDFHAIDEKAPGASETHP